MFSPEIMTEQPPERTRGMLTLLDQLKGEILTWRQQQASESPDLRAQQLFETNKSLQNLYRAIQGEVQLVPQWTDRELDVLTPKINEVRQTLPPGDSLPWFDDL